MDPNACLTEALELSVAIAEMRDDNVRIDDQVADRLAERVMALHAWLSRGGFLPRAWGSGRDTEGAVMRKLRAYHAEHLAEVDDGLAGVSEGGSTSGADDAAFLYELMESVGLRVP